MSSLGVGHVELLRIHFDISFSQLSENKLFVPKDVIYQKQRQLFQESDALVFRLERLWETRICFESFTLNSAFYNRYMYLCASQTANSAIILKFGERKASIDTWLGYPSVLSFSERPAASIYITDSTKTLLLIANIRRSYEMHT